MKRLLAVRRQALQVEAGFFNKQQAHVHHNQAPREGTCMEMELAMHVQNELGESFCKLVRRGRVATAFSGEEIVDPVGNCQTQLHAHSVLERVNAAVAVMKTGILQRSRHE